MILDELREEKVRLNATQQEMQQDLEDEARLSGRSIPEILDELQETAREMREDSIRAFRFLGIPPV